MSNKSKYFEETAELVRFQDISRRHRYPTPFGDRLVCYTDLTASGRHLQCVEDWIAGVHPMYANSHSLISSTGLVVTRLREQAREIIRRSVNGNEDDIVVFVGSGATSAVNKLVGILGFRISEPLESTYRLSEKIPDNERPLVFLGPYEHHSNELPWIESVVDVEEIPLTDCGRIDIGHLERRLEETAGRPMRIGSFNAASNVTGILSDVDAIARVLRRHGALAFFDYAAAAPYVPIDMHPADPDCAIDALFLSPHKFVGGPGGSGVLVANSKLFRTCSPERPGGGTVDYVVGPEPADVDYVPSLARREEGGTPAIMGDLRTSAAFLIKDRAGADTILHHEMKIGRAALERLERHPKIKILGPMEQDRLAVLSFSIEGLNHDFASILLDHLFGIQNRSGCSCAGPYGHLLLDIHRDKSDRFRELLKQGIHGLKPGWVRVSLPWYIKKEEIDFILEATEFVADHGFDFIPLYEYDWTEGTWHHRENDVISKSIPALNIEALLKATRPVPGAEGFTESQLRKEQADYLKTARKLAADLKERWEKEPPVWNPPTGNATIDELVWFKYVHSTAH